MQNPLDWQTGSAESGGTANRQCCAGQNIRQIRIYQEGCGMSEADGNISEKKKAQEAQYKRMTGEKMSTLITQLSIPTIISMLVTNIYNMGDTYFVSALGTSASGATGIVFGLMAIFQAFGFMFGHGAGTNISRHLGMRNLGGAKKYSAHSFYLSIIVGAAVGVIGIIFINPLCRLLGSTDTILPYARIYAFYILISGPAMTSACVMNNILRYEGRAFYAMIGLTSGGILNLFGDAYLIRVLHMGIGGAGLSTAVSQYISCVILILPFLRGKTQSTFEWKNCTFEWHYMKHIIMNGTPSLARQSLNAISTMVINQLAGGYGDAAVAAVSIVNRVMFFLNCTTIGIGQGFQPVAAFNYGAGIYSRVRSAYLYVLKLALCIMSVLAVISFCFAPNIVNIFIEDPQVIAIGSPMMRVQCVSMLTMPFAVFGDMLFQSIGMPKRATLLASLRRGLLAIPYAVILTAVIGLVGLQWAQGLADISTAAIAAPMCYKFLKNLPPDYNRADS